MLYAFFVIIYFILPWQGHLGSKMDKYLPPLTNDHEHKEMLLVYIFQSSKIDQNIEIRYVLYVLNS